MGDYIALESVKQIAETLEKINKNLEKIANNTEKDNVKPMQDLSHKGEFYGPIKKELNLDTIICNQNKDGYVDKNIVLD